MSALSTDARSIGQVLYEATKQPGWPGWDSALPGTRDHFERAAEVIFNRGFKAGCEAQKLADPTPKAKQYRDEAVEARATLANLIARVSAVRSDLARANLEAPVGESPPLPSVENALNELGAALAEAL